MRWRVVTDGPQVFAHTHFVRDCAKTPATPPTSVGGSLISAYVEARALSPVITRVAREERYQNKEEPAAST
jgi:hypothetical protein